MARGVYQHKPHTEEWKKMISEKLRGRKKKPFTKEHVENLRKSHLGQISAMKGKKHTKEALEKMSRNRKGKMMGNTYGFKKGQIPWNKGLGGFLGKENHYCWKGGITPLMHQIRHSFKYRQWRSDIFTRDGFTCQECNKNHCWIEAHHIKRFSEIIEEYQIKTLEQALICEELWNINNGITLCGECHKKYKKFNKK